MWYKIFRLEYFIQDLEQIQETSIETAFGCLLLLYHFYYAHYEIGEELLSDMFA